MGAPGDWQYSGPHAASEPETQAMTAFMLDIRPELTIWYHQDYYRIAPSTGRDGDIRERYAELTGLPLLPIDVGIYTGTATTWERNALDPGMAFIVELGPTLTDAEAEVHAAAVLTVASELD
jgi:murein peptide amidase A